MTALPCSTHLIKTTVLLSLLSLSQISLASTLDPATVGTRAAGVSGAMTGLANSPLDAILTAWPAISGCQ